MVYLSFPLCYIFLGSLSYTYSVYKQWRFIYFFVFIPSLFFLATSPARGGGHDRLFFLLIALKLFFPLSIFLFCLFFVLLFLLIPFVIFAHLLSLLPTRNSDPGSHSRLFYSLPATVRAFIFIARRFQPFLPSSTRIEW